MLRLAPRAFARFVLRWWAHDARAAFPREILDAYLDAAAKPGATRVTLAYHRSTLYRALLRRDSPGPRHRPAAPAVPWRVLWGGDDPVSPPANIRFFQEDLPGVPIDVPMDVPMDVIAGAGHFPQEERPAAFNEKLLAFLHGNVTGSGP